MRRHRRPHIRPKAVRRLLILAAIIGVAGGSIGVAFVAHRRADNHRIDATRAAGLTAFAHGDYAASLPDLRATVNARPDDADVLFALAAAQVALDPQNPVALVDARTRLEQLLRIAPQHAAARHELLDLYERTGLSREMLDLADGLLATDHADTLALRGRALALSRLNRDAEALPAWQAYIAAEPTDLRGQLQLIAAMRLAGATPEALVAHAQQLADAHPGDARYRLPLAEVMRDAGRDAEALATLRALAADPPKDEATLVELVAALDRVRAFDDAEHLLVRASDALGSGSTTVTTALVERLWESGRGAETLELTDRLLAAGRRDAGVLAMRIVTLAAAGRRAEADPLLKELAGRTGDAAALAWTDAFTPEFAATPAKPADRVRWLRSAVTRDPSNAIARVWLARALIAVGEPDAASAQYREAAQRVASWATPCVELAELMRGTGRIADAKAAVKAALLRSPNSPAAQVMSARVQFAELDAAGANADSSDEAALLVFVGALRERLPDEPTLAPIHVALLARAGQVEAARTLLAATIARTGSAAMLNQCYAIDRRYQLGQADAVLGRATVASLLTPDLITRRATDLIADGQPGAAVTLVSAQAIAHPDDLDWALADAHVRARAHDAGAADAWTKLLAAHGDDVRVVTGALDDNDAADGALLAGGRDAQAALIERLRAIDSTSDDANASAYRMRRARFLAGSDDPQEVRQALSLATELVRQQPDRVQWRVLLAHVLVKLDNPTTAIEHLRTAYEQSPADTAVGLEYAALLRREGRLDDALPVLRRIASFDATGAVAATLRSRIAAELLNVGLPDVAATMLGRAAQRHTLDPDGRLLYAEALRASGDTAGATAAYRAAVADEARPTPTAFAAAAAFARADGRRDEADALLARLDALAPSADRSRALARYHATFDEVEAARAAFDAGLPLAIDASLACDAIAFELSQHDLARADARCHAAESRFGDDARLRRARLELTARRGDSSADGLGGLIAVLAADPSTKPQADALAALRDARAGQQPITPALADSLTRLAMQHDDGDGTLALTQLAIRANLETNRTAAATALAQRLAAEYPARADAQACAARTLADCKQPTAARRAAERWRSIDPSHVRDADVLLASLALDAHDPTRATALLAPYRTTPIDAKSEADLPLAIALARTLAATAHPDDGFALLAPALHDRPAVRAAWLSIAAGMDPAGAIRRLTDLNAVTPADAADERAQLAGTCLTLAMNGVDGSAALGLTALTSVQATPDAAGTPLRVLRGELQRAGGDMTGAESTLREALRLAPDDVSAKNSLAFLLVSGTGGAAIPAARADEAATLARAAVDAKPQRADLRDTLARAEWAAGRTDQAARIFREALRIDPACIDAVVGLAALNVATGHADQANAALPAIERTFANGKVPMHLQRDVAAVRTALSAARDD